MDIFVVKVRTPFGERLVEQLSFSAAEAARDVAALYSYLCSVTVVPQ